jgi:hypothetical protein
MGPVPSCIYPGEPMNRTILAMLALALLSGSAAQAADKRPTPSELMHEIDGVYKHRFQNTMVVPGQANESYQSEDVIEVVPYDEEHLYLRAHLEFANGHTCDIAGMAGYEHGAFVYHDPEPPMKGERACALRLHVTDKKLVLTDRETPDAEATCRAYCGARGSLDYEIGRDARREIRYGERLKKSREYKKAVGELQPVEQSR